MIDKLANREPISISLIKEIHKQLTKGTYDEVRYGKGERPGEYKKGDYIVGINEIGGLASEVGNDLNELLDEINDKQYTDY